MSRQTDKPSTNVTNHNQIKINTTLFLTLFGICMILIGVAAGFAWGQHNAMLNLENVQAAVLVGLQEMRSESGLAVESAIPSQPGDDPVEAAVPVEADEAQMPQALEVIEVSVDDDPYMGPEDAPVTIVEFSDFQCAYCGRFREQTFDTLIDAYGDQVRFVYRDFPLSSMHPQSQKAAEAAQCAHDQEMFWPMHDLLLSNQSSLNDDSYTQFAQELQLDVEAFDQCLESGKYEDEVLADLEDGLEYGVTGTPAFFVNGRLLMGALPFEQFSAAIEAELGKLK